MHALNICILCIIRLFSENSSTSSTDCLSNKGNMLSSASSRSVFQSNVLKSSLMLFQTQQESTSYESAGTGYVNSTNTKGCHRSQSQPTKNPMIHESNFWANTTTTDANSYNLDNSIEHEMFQNHSNVCYEVFQKYLNLINTLKLSILDDNEKNAVEQPQNKHRFQGRDDNSERKRQQSDPSNTIDVNLQNNGNALRRRVSRCILLDSTNNVSTHDSNRSSPRWATCSTPSNKILTSSSAAPDRKREWTISTSSPDDKQLPSFPFQNMEINSRNRCSELLSSIYFNANLHK